MFNFYDQTQSTIKVQLPGTEYKLFPKP